MVACSIERQPGLASNGTGGLRIEDLRRAIDTAARQCGALVNEFVMATDWRSGAMDSSERAIELAVEFLVPPVSGGQFSLALDATLMGCDGCYRDLRQRNMIDKPVIYMVAPGAFHQWRVSRRREAAVDQRVGGLPGREALDGVVMQSRIGWRE